MVMCLGYPKRKRFDSVLNAPEYTKLSPVIGTASIEKQVGSPDIWDNGFQVTLHRYGISYTIQDHMAGRILPASPLILYSASNEKPMNKPGNDATESHITHYICKLYIIFICNLIGLQNFCSEDR